MDICHFSDLLTALERRLVHFAQHGCVASDHGIEILRYAPVPDESVLDAILQKRLAEIFDETATAQFAWRCWSGSESSMRNAAGRCSCTSVRCATTIRACLLCSVPTAVLIPSVTPVAYPLSRLLDENG